MFIPKRVLTAILLSSSVRCSRSFSTAASRDTKVHHFRLANNCQGRSIRTVMSLSSDKSMSDAETSEQDETVSRIVNNLENVRNRIQAVCAQSDRSVDSVRLVAVSKTQPFESLLAAYQHGNQRVFGENYVQELLDKVQHFSQLQQQDDDDNNNNNNITWHFIGTLQSNKVNAIVSAFGDKMDQLVIETVASVKLANKLNSAVASQQQQSAPSNSKLKIFIQVNTSGEASKGGLEIDENYASILSLCKHVRDECLHLRLMGLMTIGAPNDDNAFDKLKHCREAVERELGLRDTLELSMGMSDDFETAIAKGSTNVRVGSTIFGARNYSSKQ
ncbi:hypothetical protein MPSEU_000177900 [Mayamaea pseudoterrestris]|nr:hypothetical protein MPSEU_000177900 [Mayamaea pseudoterrestris]